MGKTIGEGKFSLLSCPAKPLVRGVGMIGTQFQRLRESGLYVLRDKPGTKNDWNFAPA